MQMLQENLTPCANFLYQWIVRRTPSKNNTLKIDIRDFQAWSAEFRDFPYSEREVMNALKQLKQLELIGVAKTEVTIRAKQWDYPKAIGQKPARSLLLRPVYLMPCIIVFLAVAILGTLKLTPITNASAQLKTQLQNLKLPNPWGASNQK